MKDKQQILYHIREQLLNKEKLFNHIKSCYTNFRKENVQEIDLRFYEGTKLSVDVYKDNKITISKEGEAEEQLISDIVDALEKYRNTRMKEVDEIDKELESLLK